MLRVYLFPRETMRCRRLSRISRRKGKKKKQKKKKNSHRYKSNDLFFVFRKSNSLFLSLFLERAILLVSEIKAGSDFNVFRVTVEVSDAPTDQRISL